jgi:folylpolyglutamate synthase/dihydropteroate synthase
LGDTLEKIAWEKGGIFAVDKASQVVSARPSDNDSDPETRKQTLDDNATVHQSNNFYILDSNTRGVLNMMSSCALIEGHGGSLQEVDASGQLLKEGLKGESLGLAGQHQYGNATLAVTLCRAATNNENIMLTSELTLTALMKASWPARCQTYQPPDDSRFLYLLDGAHTPQSITATVEWFSTKLKALYSNPETRPDSMPILVFNTSHERNPVELLQIIVRLMLPNVQFDSETASGAIFSKTYFAKSDSSRPSPVRTPTAKELLVEQGIDIKESLFSPLGAESWQDTLEVVYKHIVDFHPTNGKELTFTNMTAAQVIQDISDRHNQGDSGKRIPVLVTGSLYLVGSFLNALEWEEESSPAK